MKLVKLDRRHTGHQFLAYYVEPGRTWAIGKSTEERVEQFFEWRNWCWEVFGPGVERKWITLHPTGKGLESLNRWCWHTEYDEMRLYFKDEATASAFMFHWNP